MITYAVGDATNPPERPVIVAHVVNDVGLFGAGFAKAIAVRWPSARDDYLEWHRNGFRLGEVRLTAAEPGVWVAHLAAQHGVGRRNRPLRLGALATCLETLAATAEHLAAAVACPRLGCGLAGGSWTEVEPQVAKLALRVPVTVYDLTEPTEGA